MRSHSLISERNIREKPTKIVEKSTTRCWCWRANALPSVLILIQPSGGKSHSTFAMLGAIWGLARILNAWSLTRLVTMLFIRPNLVEFVSLMAAYRKDVAHWTDAF